MRIPHLVASLALAATLLAPVSAAAAPAAQACEFQLGFKALHDQIPDIVGDCVSDETHNPDNGDGLQETTGGLLVWRKADNWTAFTNGSLTWLAGPNGLESRRNNERFGWEAGFDDLFAAFPGDWGTAGLTLGIRRDGQAAAAWRVDRWCSDAPEPCDERQDGGVLPGGHAIIRFSKVSSSDVDRVATGYVTESSDETTMPNGDLLLIVDADGSARLALSGNNLVLCGPFRGDSPDFLAGEGCP